MSEKTVNYTPEMTAKMVEAYNSGHGMTIEAIAEMVGKSTRSVIAKLTREKVYIAKAKGVTKTGEPVQRKSELANAIGAVLVLTESEIEGLAGAPKTALQKIFTALANSRPM